jgi:hypothetical protein
MYNKFTRVTGIASISILSVALVSVASAAPLSPSASTGSTQEVAVASVIAVVSDSDEARRLQARKAIVASPLAREYRAAVSKDAKDWKGYEKSLYRGKYYHKDQEHFRECVMFRESRHNYRAANKTSSARGAYQFLDNSWRDGLVYMMIKESKKTDDGLSKNIRRLFDKPIQQWSRYMQDRAFFTAMNINGKWSGKHHWRFTVPGTGC